MSQPFASIPSHQPVTPRVTNSAVEFDIGELEAILQWAEARPFHATIATDHEELPEVAEFYRPGETEQAYSASRRASGTVEVTQCYMPGRQREAYAIVADVPTALAWIEAREGGAWGPLLADFG